MNVIDELRDMNLQELYGKLQLSDEEFDDWLTSMGLLHRHQVCDFCGDPMKHEIGRMTWVCYKRDCRRAAGGIMPRKGLFAGTFFEVFFNFWSQVAALYPCHQ
jgi:hypothetical protein